MATVNVTIRMDETLKKQADELFSDLGLSLNAAFTIFAKQSVREQRIPFEITRSSVTVTPDFAVNEVSRRMIEQNIIAYKELAK